MTTITTPLTIPHNNMTTTSTSSAITAACERIAPTWPLDQFIAVNPYWGWRSLPIDEAAARLATLSGTRLTADSSDDCARLPLVTDIRDRGAGPRPGLTWTDHVLHQIGQHCASHFDQWQSSWQPHDLGDLYNSWRTRPVASLGTRWRLGADWARSTLHALPEQPTAAIDAMLDALGITDDGKEPYLTALLLSVNGWAAWCAYERWQAQLAGNDNDDIVELLAIRLAWDWLLRLDSDTSAHDWTQWAATWREADTVAAHARAAQAHDWAAQAEREVAYQQTLAEGLSAAGALPATTTTKPDVQAVFCIDVRSEVFRRSLESITPNVHTRGFAGFFGLPIAYTPSGSPLTRPQLPGLLAPVLDVSDRDATTGEAATPQQSVVSRVRSWGRFRTAPSSMFSFVESMGLLYGAKLVKEQLPHRHAPASWEHDNLDRLHAKHVRPHLNLLDDDPAAAGAIAVRVLRAMGLVDGFAPLVLLCGHGSLTTNNPHAAGLDCGACGGQTGEVNARVLASMLNDIDVRHHLSTAGIHVPSTTWFVAGLHTTTTDHVELFDTDLMPERLHGAVEQLRQWLRAAGHRARAERAPSLGLTHIAGDHTRLERTVRERAGDWSQVRPEWGLAGNAAFVVAPRARTRHLDLGGRVFLHDYDWRLDTDRSVLTLIMTAPMVVTNWINLQYHASTVDNRRYGSGNKVLHNVVGGRLGVFEGNGGDLRIGLAIQSVHDGRQFMHEPLRLSVYIEAPRNGIDTVIRDHQVVRDLVGNGWLHLFRIEPTDGSIERVTV